MAVEISSDRLCRLSRWEKAEETLEREMEWREGVRIGRLGCRGRNTRGEGRGLRRGPRLILRRVASAQVHSYFAEAAGVAAGAREDRDRPPGGAKGRHSHSRIASS